MNKKLSLILLISIALISCGRFSNKEVDGKKDMRIVCVSKQLNEMIYALGKFHNVVAVDLSSTFPDSAKLLKTVGYHRALSAEGIISMNPDIVMHDFDMGPANVLPQLEKAGLNIKGYHGGRSIDSAKILLSELGKFFGVEQRADSINKKLDADIEKVKATVTALNIKDKPSIMVIQFGRANNNYFVMSGRGGVPDKMIELAGGKVAKYDAKGARQISAEAIAVANPDIIVATDFGFDRMGSMDKFISDIPGVALTNAGKNKKVIRFEEHDLVYFGPRTGENALKLMNQVYPTKNAATK